MIELSRRSFLKIAIATIATPVIARAAITNILVPGIERVEAIKPRDLAEEARFANAIYSPAISATVAMECENNLQRLLPYGTAYELRAVRLTADQAYNRIGYGRNAYAMLWVVAPAMQHVEGWDEPYNSQDLSRIGREYVRLARSHAGTPIVWMAPESYIDERQWGGTVRKLSEPSTATFPTPLTDAEWARLEWEADE